jgi:hypothetical protein
MLEFHDRARATGAPAGSSTSSLIGRCHRLDARHEHQVHILGRHQGRRALADRHPFGEQRVRDAVDESRRGAPDLEQRVGGLLVVARDDGGAEFGRRVHADAR